MLGNPHRLERLDDLAAGAELALSDEIHDRTGEIVPPGTDVGPHDMAYRCGGPCVVLRTWLASSPAIGERGFHISLSGVMGRSRIRLPVALKIALATAAPVPVMLSSPMPRAPMGVCGSGMSVQITSISGTSMCTGT